MRPSSKFVHDGRLLILDTGVIRELATFRAVHEFHFERIRRDLRFIKTPHAYEGCARFFDQFLRKTTTASMVAELHYWIRDTDQNGILRLWDLVYSEFRSLAMDEEMIKILKMDINLVARSTLGPVDVSLIEISRQHFSEGALILTIDSELHGECLRAGLPAKHLAEITQSTN
ncbi:MAG TPA: hypothetical protein VMX16_14370 [Terriglobia bacterium]|nr:hypothetical protein [Terriglobia bacterium]